MTSTAHPGSCAKSGMSLSICEIKVFMTSRRENDKRRTHPDVIRTMPRSQSKIQAQDEACLDKWTGESTQVSQLNLEGNGICLCRPRDPSFVVPVSCNIGTVLRASEREGDHVGLILTLRRSHFEVFQLGPIIVDKSTLTSSGTD